MREANALEREFLPRNGWNRKKVESLITDLLMYLQTVDKKKLCMFACTVNVADRDKLKYEGHQIPEVVEICNEWCSKMALNWYVAEYPGLVTEMHYFFDQGEPFKEHFEKLWKRERARTLEPSPDYLFWSLIKTVTTADMRDKPGLQAADLFAWATNRNESKVGQRFKLLSSLMKHIIPWKTVFCDEKKLKELYKL